MRVSEAGEFGLIDKIADFVDKTSLKNSSPWRDLLIGIGDDAAAWKGRAMTGLITTDVLVEGTHFNLSHTGWKDLGWKSIAINVSDIYAMGGRPQYALVSLALPGQHQVHNVLKMYEGMVEACNKYGIALAGGNISFSGNIVINIALTGTAPNGLLKRSSAKPGDLVAVFGYPGLSAAWLKTITSRNNTKPGSLELFKQAHLHPEPKFDAGPELAACGVKTAIDISDGILSDLGHICGASKVSAVLHLGSLPAHPQLKKYYQKEYTYMMLTGGEDYQLLFTAPLPVMDKVMKAIKPAPAVIGEIIAGKRCEIMVLDSSGKPFKASSTGWDHYNKAR